MGVVIKFERFKNVTGWSLNKIADYIRKEKWAGFVLHWQEGEEVTIERTT